MFILIMSTHMICRVIELLMYRYPYIYMECIYVCSSADTEFGPGLPGVEFAFMYICTLHTYQ